MPPIIPQTVHFTRKSATEICAKIIPTVPPKGELGNGFGGIDGAKFRRYHPGQAEATRPTPSEPPTNGDQKGEVNMATPNAGELLVQQTRDAERLRLLLLANECKTLDEFRERLQELINRQ